MHRPQPISETLRREFGAFVLERYPFAATSAREALAAATGAAPILESAIDRLRDPLHANSAAGSSVWRPSMCPIPPLECRPPGASSRRLKRSSLRATGF